MGNMEAANAEVERIMKMSDAELIAEIGPENVERYAAEGRDSFRRAQIEILRRALEACATQLAHCLGPDTEAGRMARNALAVSR